RSSTPAAASTSSSAATRSKRAPGALSHTRRRSHHGRPRAAVVLSATVPTDRAARVGAASAATGVAQNQPKRAVAAEAAPTGAGQRAPGPRSAQLERHVDRADVFGQATDRDEVHAIVRDRGQAVELHATRDLQRDPPGE